MIGIAVILLYLGIFKRYEPLLLVPIGFGVLIANFPEGNMAVISAAEVPEIEHMTIIEIAKDFGIMNMLYYTLIKTGLLPPLIFLGVGAMTDFGPMLRNLRLAFFGAAAQADNSTVSKISTARVITFFIRMTPRRWFQALPGEFRWPCAVR